MRWAGFGLLLVFALTPARAASFSNRIHRVDAMAQAEWEQDRIGSLTVGVIEDGKLAWTRSYGDADMERRVAATPDTVYRVGSITKSVTAVMLSQLVEQGRVHLSDPVERYVPEIRRVRGGYSGAAPVTLFELATHTSGLAREPDNAGAYVMGPVSGWETTLVAALGRTRYLYEPGIRYSYSNVGYAVLGLALERAAARPYVDYVTGKILRPLGMAHTAFVPNAAMRGNIAKGYGVTGGKIDLGRAAREREGRGYKVPNGGLYSTVGDLARFATVWLGDAPVNVLKKRTLDEMFQQAVAADVNLSHGYGRGFHVFRRGELVAMGHGGQVAGFLAALYLDRGSRTGVIVLANENGGKARPSSLAMRALAALAGS
ncbi:MAG: serine hydrolase domain-containing protein [Bryobacteraceae bacterium]